MPAHAASWARYPGLRDIACSFSQTSYMGSLDISMSRTYRIAEDIIKDLTLLFPSKRIHLGGDEYAESCHKNNSFVLPSGETNLMHFKKHVIAYVK